MLETALILGIGMCASFGILLWKLPKKIRAWMLRRQLLLDASFTAFVLAVILPFATGPTALLGATVATIAWTFSIYTMHRIEENEIKISGLLEGI